MAFYKYQQKYQQIFHAWLFFESVLLLSRVHQIEAPFAIKGGSQFETPFGKTALETEHKLNSQLNTGAGVKPCVVRFGACRRSKLNTNRTQTEHLPNYEIGRASCRERV